MTKRERKRRGGVRYNVAIRVTRVGWGEGERGLTLLFVTVYECIDYGSLQGGTLCVSLLTRLRAHAYTLAILAACSKVDALAVHV